MFAGIFVCVASWYYMNNGTDCSVHPDNIWAGAVMYASYFILFLKFAIERFILGGGKKKKRR